MASLEAPYEFVAIATIDGEVLDVAGDPGVELDVRAVRDLVELVQMVAARGFGDPQLIEVVFRGRKLAIVIDPPLVRIGIAKDVSTSL